MWIAHLVLIVGSRHVLVWDMDERGVQYQVDLRGWTEKYRFYSTSVKSRSPNLFLKAVVSERKQPWSWVDSTTVAESKQKKT